MRIGYSIYRCPVLEFFVICYIVSINVIFWATTISGLVHPYKKMSWRAPLIKTTRRRLLALLGSGISLFLALPLLRKLGHNDAIAHTINDYLQQRQSHDRSQVYWVKNGTPYENVRKILEMMGGIEQFVGKNDIVILKPNAQWWNQGRTNLWAMKCCIDQILAINGFNGEIIIGENQHFMDSTLPAGEEDNVRGWITTGDINGDIDGEEHSLNSLIALYQRKGIPNVTKAHWRDGGPKRPGSWGSGQNGGVVKSPAEGDGYVWSDEEYVYKKKLGLKSWRVKMSYPVFTSSYSGVTIDLKEGAFLRDGKGGGRYLAERPVRLINFPVLNTHGKDTGITSSIKNYMGITDMSCGRWGKEPDGYVNVHQCGGKRYPFAKAGPLGHFMKTIRMADLNIVTAEWVGWGHRTNITKATRMKSILAGTDPVALDYCGAKYLILPLSKKSMLHDPDNPKSPIHNFLQLARKTMGAGAVGEQNIEMIRHDFSA